MNEKYEETIRNKVGVSANGYKLVQGEPRFAVCPIKALREYASKNSTVDASQHGLFTKIVKGVELVSILPGTELTLNAVGGVFFLAPPGGDFVQLTGDSARTLLGPLKLVGEQDVLFCCVYCEVVGVAGSVAAAAVPVTSSEPLMPKNTLGTLNAPRQKDPMSLYMLLAAVFVATGAVLYVQWKEAHGADSDGKAKMQHAAEWVLRKEE